MRGIFWLIVLAAFGAGMWLIAVKITVVPQEKLCFLEKGCVWVKVAQTQEDQVQGLSGKWFMVPDAGMLFVYEEAEVLTFWMKQMQTILLKVIQIHP